VFCQGQAPDDLTAWNLRARAAHRQSASRYWVEAGRLSQGICSLWKPAGLGGISKAVDDGLLTGLKIVSGGQTGADRSALDWAIAHGVPHGGWCPKGWLAEDGPIDARYKLEETPSKDYVQRTEWNARDSDGTVVFSIKAVLTGGSKKTVNLARQHHKPVLHLWRDGGLSSPEGALLRFIRHNNIKVLNVAGPRASKESEVAAFVKDVLERTFMSSRASREPGTSRAQPAGGKQPTLETARLILRPYTLEDAPTVATLAGKREIADTTISIPHPYSEQQARDWITRHIEGRSHGKGVIFAVVTKTDMQLVGSVGLRDIDQEHGQAEVEMWIGVDWWGQGYATEAAKALLQFGFETLRLNRIYAHHMLRNPASGRVLEKIGMKKEGVLRERVCKWGVFENVAILSVIRKEWPGRERLA
jgi:[ribosomal protein S5]-alanine N-acetyltransferase